MVSKIDSKVICLTRVKPVYSLHYPSATMKKNLLEAEPGTAIANQNQEG